MSEFIAKTAVGALKEAATMADGTPVTDARAAENGKCGDAPITNRAAELANQSTRARP